MGRVGPGCKLSAHPDPFYRNAKNSLRTCSLIPKHKHEVTPKTSYQMFNCFHIRNAFYESLLEVYCYCFIQSHNGLINFGCSSLQCESKKIPPWGLVAIFLKPLGILQPNFTCLLCVPIYARVPIFIQLPATLTKLCHNKRDHHNVFKMSTIDRNARWVVALNMASSKLQTE